MDSSKTTELDTAIEEIFIGKINVDNNLDIINHLLKSLIINVTKNLENENFKKDLQEFLKLKDIESELKGNEFHETLATIRAVSNKKSLSIVDANFEIEEFNEYLSLFKNLSSLTLTNCIVSGVNDVEELNNSFESLTKLRFLKLDKVNTQMLNIIRTKWIRKLTKLELNCKSDQWEIAEQFYEQCKMNNLNMKFVAKRKFNTEGEKYCSENSKTNSGEKDTFDDPFDNTVFKIVLKYNGICIRNKTHKLFWNEPRS